MRDCPVSSRHLVEWRPWLITVVGLGVMMMPWMLHQAINRGLLVVDVESGMLLALYAVWVAHGQLTERLESHRQANADTGYSAHPESP